MAAGLENRCSEGSDCEEGVGVDVVDVDAGAGAVGQTLVRGDVGG